ncbi:Mu transposase C-terminal domain-containing protein [Alkalibacillus salilacus]|nr:Mu transposase C-terminal domain-containing protein [Alkalibacillus salilacus]
MNYYQNMIFRNKDGEVWRVLDVNHFDKTLIVIELHSQRLPYVLNQSEVKHQYAQSNLEIIKEDYFTIAVDDSQITSKQKAKRDHAWEIVQYTISQVDEHRIYDSKYRQKAIKQTNERFGVGYSTVKKYLIKYWQRGMTLNALLPDYFKCGMPGHERKHSNIKRGRPRSNGKKGVNIDETVKKKIKAGLNRHYYTDKQNTLMTAYELTIRDFFTEVIKDSYGQESRVVKNEIPTYNQFRYWFKKYNDPKHEISKRFGSRVYYQQYRPIVGDSTQDAGFGPGNLWQTDSTPLDVYCVSSVDRNAIVGKPLLHLVIDVYSRVIVGFSLSFESLNAYSGAMNALYNSMTPKDEFCKRFGIELEGEWDIDCVPQRIFTDRGELSGKQIENAITNLGISIQNSPGYRPETKAIIEQAFHQMMQRITPHVDGAVVSGNRVKERGEKDYRLYANLTVHDLTKILIRCIIFYNNHHLMSDYELSEDMMNQGVKKIPMDIWQYGVSHVKGTIRKLPSDVIKMHLLPTTEATVTAKGIKFKKMFYVSSYGLQQNWFQQARDKTWKEKIWYDPTDLTHIFIFNREEQSFITFSLVDHLEKYKSKSIDEVNVMLQAENEKDKSAKEDELQAKMQLLDQIEEIVRDGAGKTSKELNEEVSKSQKVNDIQENRRFERELNRKNNRHTEPESDRGVSSVEDETDLELFKRLRQEEE